MVLMTLMTPLPPKTPMMPMTLMVMLKIKNSIAMPSHRGPVSKQLFEKLYFSKK